MKALVIGLGKSGKGAAKLLLKQDYAVYAVDRIPQKMEGVTVCFEDEEIKADLVVLSSGVPRSHPQAKGCVVGEAELAIRALKNKMVGITGTNGKTTVTLLVTHVLNASGIRARALGNVGVSLAEYACAPDPKEILVVELSSYQLETLETVAFDVGLITNITPDHLDRYPSFEAYRDTKLRLKDLIQEGGTFIEEGDSYLQLTKNERYWKSIGPHAVCMAWKICKVFDVTWEDFNAALITFNKPPHRMEIVDMVEGITFINDSKGTNIESVMYGVNQIEGSIFLIAGGQGKGDSFKKWKKPFTQKVKGIFAIGETALQIEKELGDAIPTLCCESLRVAVDKARNAAHTGDTVLFSPGCASFDQFRDYEERGEMFKEIIREVRK
ncbi:Mur ligase family protein [Candidatus Neptunichlamydia sp. REUL1]|uniref:Mur ligase family protein n=1 Tax=Candidatus Neptunichlamydia sp. REUL1 TaxID=3064277 RepID=UPI002931A946|nr:Mur ligase family protein [Candidatus Neptunochlamydia sp. REUL1]